MLVKLQINWKLKAAIIQAFGSQSMFAVLNAEKDSTVSRIIHRFEKLSPERMEQWAQALESSTQELFESNGNGKTRLK